MGPRWFLRLALSAACVGVLLGWGIAAALRRSHHAPSAPDATVLTIDLPGPEFTFGELRQDELVSRVLSVRNPGPDPVRVQGVESGCGCLRAKLEGSEIVGPHEERSLVLTADTRFLAGTHHREVRILGPQGLTLARLAVEIAVRRGLILNSRAIHFGRHEAGHQARGMVRLSVPLADPPLSITSVLSPDTDLAWDLTEEAQDDPALCGYSLTIIHPGTHRLGLVESEIRVRTNRKDVPEFALTSTLQVGDSYFSLPPVASFGFVNTGAPSALRRVVVRSTEALDGWSVSKARVEGQGAFSAGNPVRLDSSSWAVDVACTGTGTPGQSLESALIIEIVNPAAEVRVPLRATLVTK